MTRNKAFEILTAKYPKVTFNLSDISINDDNIEVWSDPGCEFNSHAYCTDWFDFDGNHLGHKCK